MVIHLGSRRTALSLILAAACWGLGTVISKRALDEIPPFTLLPIQLAASVIALAALMRARGLRLRGDTGDPILGRLGLLNPGLAYAFSLVGLVSITASLSVLLWAGEPLLILVLAAVLLHERLTASLVAFSVAAVAGLLLVVVDPATSGQWIGIGLTVAGVACCATYTVVARRWLATAGSTAQVLLVQQVYALAFAGLILLGSIVLGGTLTSGPVSAAAWLSAVVSGILYYAGAYWLYLTGLRATRASVAAVAFYLIPIFGVAGGIFLLGDQLALRQWIGAAIVLGAVVRLIWTPAAAPAPEPSASS